MKRISSKDELIKFVQEIVAKSEILKDELTQSFKVPVNYACIFCQTDEQFQKIKLFANEIGKPIEETPTGPLIHLVPAIQTVAGNLHVLKVRCPDITRPELGDADFTIANYEEFKMEYLPKAGFSLIKRPDFEMIELYREGMDVRAYFSNPPIDVQLGLV